MGKILYCKGHKNRRFVPTCDQCKILRLKIQLKEANRRLDEWVKTFQGLKKQTDMRRFSNAGKYIHCLDITGSEPVPEDWEPEEEGE